MNGLADEDRILARIAHTPQILRRKLWIFRRELVLRQGITSKPGVHADMDRRLLGATCPAGAVIEVGASGQGPEESISTRAHLRIHLSVETKHLADHQRCHVAQKMGWFIVHFEDSDRNVVAGIILIGFQMAMNSHGTVMNS